MSSSVSPAETSAPATSPPPTAKPSSAVASAASSPERAAEVARDLIERDQVALMLAASTPETTNPVADVCEEAGLPCISTATPYQSWFRHRNPAPDPTRPEPYRWTWHFFWGL